MISCFSCFMRFTMFRNCSVSRLLQQMEYSKETLLAVGFLEELVLSLLIICQLYYKFSLILRVLLAHRLHLAVGRTLRPFGRNRVAQFIRLLQEGIGSRLMVCLIFRWRLQTQIYLIHMSSTATAERQKHVQELRKAHFYFGFDKETNFNSVAKDPIPVVKNSKIRPASSFQPDSAQIPKMQLQKNHFHLGNDVAQMQSIQKSDYQRPQSAIPSKLSEETKKDLRSHHFQLGFHGTSLPSEYKTKYKSGETHTQKKSDNENIRKHHHDFGDSNNYYSSMYDQMHNKQYDKNYLGQGYKKEQMAAMGLELRKTNLIMGRDNPQYETQNNAIYQAKPLMNNFQDDKLKQLIRNTHIQIGSDRVEYQTHTKGVHTGAQPKEGVALNEAQLKDLRATHFGMGNEGVSYDSAYKQNFKDPQSKQPDQLHQQFQKNNFTLKDAVIPQSNDHYTSSYKRQFDGRAVDEPAKQVVDRSKNVKIGDERVTYQSEAAAQFQNPRSGPGKLDQEVQKDLRSHHFAFGQDKDPLQSTTKTTFIGNRGNAAKLDEAMKKDLRQHHFSLGFASADYKTHQMEFGSKQGPPNQLPPDVAQRIKQSSQKHQ